MNVVILILLMDERRNVDVKPLVSRGGLNMPEPLIINTK
jgi:hypothetical protein